jgi:hypothetical protein
MAQTPCNAPYCGLCVCRLFKPPFKVLLEVVHDSPLNLHAQLQAHLLSEEEAANLPAWVPNAAVQVCWVQAQRHVWVVGLKGTALVGCLLLLLPSRSPSRCPAGITTTVKRVHKRAGRHRHTHRDHGSRSAGGCSINPSWVYAKMASKRTLVVARAHDSAAMHVWLRSVYCWSQRQGGTSRCVCPVSFSVARSASIWSSRQKQPS